MRGANRRFQPGFSPGRSIQSPAVPWKGPEEPCERSGLPCGCRRGLSPRRMERSETELRLSKSFLRRWKSQLLPQQSPFLAPQQAFPPQQRRILSPQPPFPGPQRPISPHQRAVSQPRSCFLRPHRRFSPPQRPISQPQWAVSPPQWPVFLPQRGLAGRRRLSFRHRSPFIRSRPHWPRPLSVKNQTKTKN